MRFPQAKLEEIVVSNKLVSDTQLKELKSEAKKKKLDLYDLLIERDVLTDDELGRLISSEIRVNFANVPGMNIPEDTLMIVPQEMAEGKGIIALKKTEKSLHLGMIDPFDKGTVALMEKKTGLNVQPFLISKRGHKSGLEKYEKDLGAKISKLASIPKGATAEDLATTSVVETVDTIIDNAYKQKASDIHIEPHEKQLIVRYRIDGILQDVVILDKKLLEPIISRIKILSGLRTDEHRAAQDGKIRKTIGDNKLDIRISIVPLVDGEKAVMRLLSSKDRGFGLDDLGLRGKDLELVKEAAAKPWGMILSTGPTGSGKTTSLYAILKILNKSNINISTIEDPVEYDMEGVNQIQVNEKAKLTFGSGLRSIVRQDPDVIMVGEIRDNETASIAINAALTGHLLLSTLHTNDAPTTLPRLIDMKIEPFLIASTVNIVIGQRLVRRVCNACVVSYNITGTALTKYKKQLPLKKILGKDPKQITLYKSEGCDECGGQGFKGRIGIFEVMKISEGIRELIMSEANADQIREQALKDGMEPMVNDGVQKALQGLTTIDEVLRVTRA